MSLPKRLRLASFVLGLVSALTLVGCERKAEWPALYSLPRSFESYAMLLDLESDALIGGCRKNGRILESCAASLYRCSSKGCEKIYSGPGRINGLARYADLVAADAAVYVRPSDKNDHRLLLSRDSGREFHEMGPIPGSSVEKMVIRPPNELWAMSESGLIKSADWGRSWQAVESPGPRDPVHEVLAVVESALLVLGYETYRSDDGGRIWRRIDATGARVTANSSRHLFGVLDGWAVAGSLEEHVKWKWLFRLPEGSYPSQAVVEGKQWRIATSPEINARGRTVRLYESDDEGDHWSHKRLDRVYAEGRIALGSRGASYAMDVENRVLRETLQSLENPSSGN